jgi:hypothetical protein
LISPSLAAEPRRRQAGEAAADIGEARELLERADELMPPAGHRIDVRDRLDADRARSLP